MPEISTPPAESTAQPEVVNLAHANVGPVIAEMVRMHQSTAEAIEAEDVEMNTAVAFQVDAQTMTARQAVFGQVNAEQVEIAQGAVGAVRGGNIDAQGAIGVVAGGTVHLRNARVGAVAAREVRADRIESVILLAGRVEGEVHTTVDTRGAILAGLVGGLAAGLILLVGRIAFRRK